MVVSCGDDELLPSDGGANGRVLRSTVAGGRGTDHGVFEIRNGTPHLAAGAGWLRLDEVKPAGKRAMSGADWARGLRDVRADERHRPARKRGGHARPDQ